MDYLPLSDNELSTLLINGDHKAYEQLYQRYFRLLYTYAYKKLRDEEQAKDIIQEFFTELWYKRTSFFFNANIAGYFYSAIHNRIINHFSRESVKSKYIASFENFLSSETDTTDHLVREKQLLGLIEREIQALPAKMRQVFEMSRKEHLSNKEIAQTLDISERTVETQVSNALYRLRTKLGLVVFLFYFWH
ncbi:RNA polymerase sigma factor [Pedobacter sp. L105]|uniref:RNA polymerase sigma factor n=1 Tax=Pedobacter sp. L105 TaxID=1641871 RepID=UPI0020B1633C|nr:RNA polymerase sigma-70 factor [Pedobacter sp. L105]